MVQGKAIVCMICSLLDNTKQVTSQIAFSLVNLFDELVEEVLLQK